VVFFNDGALVSDICIHGHRGMAVFSVLCLTDEDYVAELHEIITKHTLVNVRRPLPEIAPYVDVIWLASDDWGTQNSTIASPKVFRKLLLPYRRRINEVCHALAPEVKTFLHSCGAIYDLLDMIVESDCAVLNSVQWPAGKHPYHEWKAKARGRLTLWGGRVKAQFTLPLGTVEDGARAVAEVVGCLG
jgi:uroporphyrinogen decarboxylase